MYFSKPYTWHIRPRRLRFNEIMSLRINFRRMLPHIALVLLLCVCADAMAATMPLPRGVQERRCWRVPMRDGHIRIMCVYIRI